MNTQDTSYNDQLKNLEMFKLELNESNEYIPSDKIIWDGKKSLFSRLKDQKDQVIDYASEKRTNLGLIGRRGVRTVGGVVFLTGSSILFVACGPTTLKQGFNNFIGVKNKDDKKEESASVKIRNTQEEQKTERANKLIEIAQQEGTPENVKKILETYAGAISKFIFLQHTVNNLTKEEAVNELQGFKIDGENGKQTELSANEAEEIFDYVMKNDVITRGEAVAMTTEDTDEENKQKKTLNGGDGDNEELSAITPEVLADFIANNNTTLAVKALKANPDLATSLTLTQVKAIGWNNIIQAGPFAYGKIPAGSLPNTYEFTEIKIMYNEGARKRRLNEGEQSENIIGIIDIAANLAREKTATVIGGKIDRLGQGLMKAQDAGNEKAITVFRSKIAVELGKLQEIDKELYKVWLKSIQETDVRFKDEQKLKENGLASL